MLEELEVIDNEVVVENPATNSTAKSTAAAVPTFSQLILHHKVINASNTMESHGIKVTEEKAESAVTRVLNLSPPPRKNLLLMGTTTVESQGCLLGQRML